MEIAEIEKRLEEAHAKSTPGEWWPCEREADNPYFYDKDGSILGSLFWPTHGPTPEETRQAEIQTYDTVEAICLAHNSLPALLAHLREQRAALRSCGEAIAGIKRLLANENEYRVARADAKGLCLADQMIVGNVFEKADDALALPLVKAVMESK